MIPSERQRYVQLRVRVYTLSKAMAQQPDDDHAWREWQQTSDEVEELWTKYAREIVAEPSIEEEIRRLTGLA